MAQDYRPENVSVSNHEPHILSTIGGLLGGNSYLMCTQLTGYER